MKVAVVIPCYNVERHVGVAVRSVMYQTYEDLDVIALDDGSTDGTVAQLKALAIEFPNRFRWVSGPRRGACATRNEGMSLTTGEYIQFLDADDTVLPDKLHRQVDLAHSSGSPDLIVGDFLNVYEDGSREEKVQGAGEQPWIALISTHLGTTSANLFKRSALEAVDGWRVEQVSSQDYELMFRMLANKATVAWDPHVSSLVLKRLSGSISRTGQRDNWLRYIGLRKDIRDYLKSTDPVGYAREIAAADQYLFMAIRVLSKHDRQAAVDAFDECLDASFVPDASTAITKPYINTFKLLGFQMAERFAMAMSWSRERFRPQ